MPKRCSVAIVGAGYTAREHARAFKSLPNVDLKGITSRTKSRAEALAAEFQIPSVVDSVEALYEATRADLVVVTVPELSMNAVAKACFQHPWTVLTEKPLGYDLADAVDIHRAAKAARSSVFVALNRRMMSSTLTVLDQLESTKGPRFIKVQDQENQARALEAGQQALVVANWMFANSVHLIDYFRLLGRGVITEVTAVVPWNAASPGPTVSLLKFASGDLGLYEGIWSGPGPWAVSATLPERRWEMRPLEQVVTQQLGSPPETPSGDPRDKDFKPGFALQAEVAVAAAIGANHPRKSRLATIDDALETMRLVARIFFP